MGYPIGDTLQKKITGVGVGLSVGRINHNGIEPLPVDAVQIPFGKVPADQRRTIDGGWITQENEKGQTARFAPFIDSGSVLLTR